MLASLDVNDLPFPQPVKKINYRCPYSFPGQSKIGLNVLDDLFGICPGLESSPYPGGDAGEQPGLRSALLNETELVANEPGPYVRTNRCYHRGCFYHLPYLVSFELAARVAGAVLHSAWERARTAKDFRSPGKTWPGIAGMKS